MNKKIIVALLLVFVMVLSVLSLSACGSEKSAGGVIEKAVNSVIELDIDSLKECVAYDVDKLLKDAMEIACDRAGMKEDDLYDEIEDRLSIKVNSIDDILDEGLTRAGYILDGAIKAVDFKYSVEIKDKEEIRSREVEGYIENFGLCLFGDGNEEAIFDYIEIDKVDDGYIVEAELEVEIFGNKENFEAELVVANYGGSQKLVSVKSVMGNDLFDII